MASQDLNSLDQALHVPWTSTTMLEVLKRTPALGEQLQGHKGFGCQGRFWEAKWCLSPVLSAGDSPGFAAIYPQSSKAQSCQRGNSFVSVPY